MQQRDRGGFLNPETLKRMSEQETSHHHSPRLFPCLPPATSHVPRISSFPEAGTYCRTFRLVM